MAYDDNSHIIADFTYDGCNLSWTHVAAKDRAKFRETIEGYVDALEGRYDVEVDLDGADYGMTIMHKGGSTATDRQVLKGDAFVIVSDTIWGGGPG